MKHSTLARASKIAYDDPIIADKKFVALGFPRVRFFESLETDTQAYIVSNSRETIVVFRGTETDKLKDILIDLDVSQTPFLYGMVHAGFLRALDSVWNEMRRELSDPQIQYQKVYVTGHSLGAALATLAAASTHAGVEELVTFGSPRVANNAFIEQMEGRVRGTRYVNNNDIVCRIPSDLRFEHRQNMVYFDPKGRPRPNVPWYIRVRENIKGRFQKDGKIGLFDGLRDHSVPLYVELLERNGL